MARGTDRAQQKTPPSEESGANCRGPASAFRPYCGSLAGYRPERLVRLPSLDTPCVWWESYGANA